MGRQIRHVPLDYQHPRDNIGNLQPMHDETFGQACAKWDEAKRLWDARETPDTEPEYFDKYSFDDWAGSRPDDAAYYRPEWPNDAVLGIQLWENTSEGTPQSPVFSDTAEGRIELANWAEQNATTFADFKASAKKWHQMLFGEKGLVMHEETMPNGARVAFI